MANYTKVRPVIKEDYKALARFLAKETDGVFQECFWLDRFQYWWDSNPVMSEDICRGWILYGGDREVGGFFGNIPIKYIINGEEKIVCSPTSWYVAEDFKKRSLELLSPFLKQNRPLLDTTPSEKVANMLVRLGFRNLEQEWLIKEAIYPVRVIGFWNFFINRAVTRKSMLFLLKIAGLFVLPSIKIFQKIHELQLPAVDRKYTIKEIQKFDNSYSSLWDKLKTKYSIMAVRNEAALNWFFFGSRDLLSSRRVIEIKVGETLIGYIAVKLVVSKLKGKSYHYFEVVDMAIIEGEESAYFALLKGLLWLVKKSEKKALFIRIRPFDKTIEDCLRRFGFFWHKGKWGFLFRDFGENNPEIGERLQHSFYATPLDGDRCYFP